MACLDMYNSEHKTGHHHRHHHNHHHHFGPAVSPRISFSNDFVDAQQALKQEMIRSSLRPSDQTAPVSSDFEFSVTANCSMMSGADELFFKGRLLPFKDTNNNTTSSHRVTTLREELLAEDDDNDDVTFRQPKGSSSSTTTTRWKSLLGLKRAHIGSNSKKAEKSDQEAHVSKTSKELLKEGGSSSSCRDDVEIGT